METFIFKGYTYNVASISGKAEFDKIYQGLLGKANKGKSIIKDLDTAYRISPSEIYLIRFDQERRALVPVRVLKEAVDGFLIKNRYDDKDRRLKMGIGNEISHQSTDIYRTVEKKHKLHEEQRKKSDEKKAQEQEKYLVTGGNVVERLGQHIQFCDRLRAILETQDLAYRENRDYKMKVDAAFQKIKDLTVEVQTHLTDVDRNPRAHEHRVTHLVPEDIDRENPPAGFLALLQQYLFLSVFNMEIEKGWITLRDYTLKLADLPVTVSQTIETIFLVMHNTGRLVISMERILFPAKFGSNREVAVQYQLRLFSQAIIDIFTETEES